MKNKQKWVISVTVITTLMVTTLTMVNFAAQDITTSQTEKSIVADILGGNINVEVVKKNINLYQNLSEVQKVAIKEKMAKMSQERQKAIKSVEKQIKEYRLQKLNSQQANNLDTQITRLQALQQYALKGNAPQTAKRFERLITLYENREVHRSLLGDNSLKVE